MLKVPCSYEVSAIGNFALLMHMSEFHLRVSYVLIKGNSRVESVKRTGHLLPPPASLGFRVSQGSRVNPRRHPTVSGDRSGCSPSGDSLA